MGITYIWAGWREVKANPFIYLCSRIKRAKSPAEKPILPSNQINEVAYDLYTRDTKRMYTRSLHRCWRKDTTCSLKASDFGST